MIVIGSAALLAGIGWGKKALDRDAGVGMISTGIAGANGTGIAGANGTGGADGVTQAGRPSLAP